MRASLGLLCLAHIALTVAVPPPPPHMPPKFPSHIPLAKSASPPVSPHTQPPPPNPLSNTQQLPSPPPSSTNATAFPNASLLPPPSTPPTPDQSLPETGDNGQPGGIFGGPAAGLFSLFAGDQRAPTNQPPKKHHAKHPSPRRHRGPRPPSPPIPVAQNATLSSTLTALLSGAHIAPLISGPEFSATLAHMTAADLAHPGTGPYPAGPFTDATLPGHTIFAPLVPPPVRVLMPVFLWAGAGCIRAGSLYAPFLSEIASHGYLVIATGNPLPPVTVENGTLGWQALSRALAQPASHPGDLSAALEWVVRRRPTRFGGVDSQAILMGGHSCGGLEVYSAAWREARVRGLMLFNSGTLDVRTRALLAEERVPVAYFTGGRTDGAEGNAEADYRALPEGLPAFKASLDTGHAGTLFSRNGGKYGKAAVEYLQWRVRGISRAKDACLRPDSPGSLVGDGWRVGFKNWLPTEKVGDSEEDDEEEGEPAAR